MQDVSALSAFFNPKSVAVVGASSNPKKPGNTALKNLVSMGCKGKIFPINPREDSILGLRCYKNMLDVPEPVEICVLLVSADLTMQVAKELVQRKSRFNDVAGAVCMSAGFGELNTSDAKLHEKELVQTLRAASIRLIGPNCLGIIDAYSGFNTNFDIPTYPKGGLSILTQSGAFANSYLFWAEGFRLAGLSKFASIGNMADVSTTELLALLKDDVSTRVIAIYLEGLPDPREFFEIARKVSAVKPIVEEIANAYESQPGKKKPFLNAVTFGHFAQEARQGLENAGLPTFEYPDMLARVAGNMACYAEFRRKAASIAREREAAGSGLRRGRALSSKLIDAAAMQGRVSLLEPEAYQVCSQYGIRVPPFRLADSMDGAIGAANEIGYPIALKVVSGEIPHKTGVGGVMLGIGSDSALKEAYGRLVESISKNAPHVRQMRMLIQKMMTASTELVLGAVRDKSFGPTVMFGLGGINIETLKMVGFRLSPLGIEEARELIRQTLPPAFLKGVRGRAAVNLDAVAGTLVSLGRLLEEQPQVEEVDLNPTLPCEDGCMAVDARIIITKSQRTAGGVYGIHTGRVAPIQQANHDSRYRGRRAAKDPESQGIRGRNRRAGFHFVLLSGGRRHRSSENRG